MSADDLASDPSFRYWVENPYAPESRFWKNYLLDNPAESEKVMAAKEIVLLTVGASPEEFDVIRKLELHQNLMHRVEKYNRVRIFRRVTLALATVAILLTGSIWYNRHANQKSDNSRIYAASYGERKSISLPDGSVVEINANSVLKLGKHWDNGIREVWLQGEAYFKIEKKPTTNTKFTVHTEDIDIEVLGTHFNVNSRNEATRVFLEEGTVRLRMKENSDSVQELLLVPGDLALVNKENHEIIRQKMVQAKSVTSWKEGYLVYDSSSLEEVIRDIQNTYGKKVHLYDQTLLAKRINGAIPTNNLGEFIKVVELLFGVKVSFQDDAIIFE